jgi:serralysin
LTGGAGNDIFSFGAYVFTFAEANIGIDTITDFTAGQDKINLYLPTFTALPFTFESPLEANNFAVVADDAAVATNAAQIVYSQSTSTLFYNANGAAIGLGEGSAFAKLIGNPTLTAADIITSLQL